MGVQRRPAAGYSCSGDATFSQRVPSHKTYDDAVVSTRMDIRRRAGVAELLDAAGSDDAGSDAAGDLAHDAAGDRPSHGHSYAT